MHGVCKVQDELKSVLSPAPKIFAPLISLAPKRLQEERAAQAAHGTVHPTRGGGFGEGGPQLLPPHVPARSPLTQGMRD